ncbi:MAG: SCP2 sterol-binding domain-containing protein [Planctomycetota bacterium]|nr:SCP2 sterol-binding domain-containing protein [Planctomycetota bacterium]
MSKLDTHPSVLAVRQRPAAAAHRSLSLAELRALALEAGADDVSAVSLDHPELAEEKPHALAAMPSARSFIALVQRTLPSDIRSPKRSVANHEFHGTGRELDEIARRLAQELTARGHAAMNPPMAFPMEMSEFPGRTWIVSHKRVAVAAQLGRMGLHRNVIHPRLGSFVLLGTVLTSAEFEDEPPQLAFDPCVDCRLCVAACPVGAIEPDGGFRFSACYDHNYREFMSGFSDFVEQVVESDDKQDFRERVPLNETVSTWQSLAYGPNYKAAYCIAVCPAGEDVLGPFLSSRAGFLDDVVRPLTERVETVYAVRGSDAAAHVVKRFPHKRLRLVQSSLRPTDARAFFRALPLLFQRGPARGWTATFHFELTGEQAVRATVRIDDGTLQVDEGVLNGVPDLRVETEGTLWIDVVNRRRNPVLATLAGRLKLRGDRGLLERFSACFPR